MIFSVVDQSPPAKKTSEFFRDKFLMGTIKFLRVEGRGLGLGS